MSLAVLADHMASKGRGPDSMLIHMSPREVQGLQALAMKHGGSLTINPDTGLPEAGFLDKLLPAIIGAGLTMAGVPPNVSAMIVGGVQTVRTGDIGKGIQAGLGAYGGANLSAGITAAGSTEAALSQGALNEQLASAAQSGISSGDAFNQFLTSDANPAVSEIAKTASPFEKFMVGAKEVAADPMSFANKDNLKYLAAAAGPAILAGANVQAKGPQTVTKPGMIRPYSYDPYSGGFTAASPYEAAPTRAAEGGLMGMAQGGAFDFAQRSEPVLRMAEGGIAGYAPGGVTDQQIKDWFAANQGASDTDIYNAMKQYNVGTEQLTNAMGFDPTEVSRRYDVQARNDIFSPTRSRSEQESMVNQYYQDQGISADRLSQTNFGYPVDTRESRLESAPFTNLYEKYQQDLAATGRYDAPADAQYRAQAVYMPDSIGNRGSIQLIDSATGQQLTNFGANDIGNTRNAFELLDKFGVDPASYRRAASQMYESLGKPTYMQDDYAYLTSYKPRDVTGKTDMYLTKPLTNVTMADLKPKYEKDDNARQTADSKTNVFWMRPMQQLLMSKGIGASEATNYLHQLTPVSGLVDWAEISKSEDPVKAIIGTLNYLQSKGLTNRRFASGGLASLADNMPGYANGALVSDKQIFDYFATPTPGRTDADIARDMQTYNVTAADIARATGTGNRQGEYETRFVQAIAKPDVDTSEFMAATQDVGLQNQALANALQNSGLSAAAQYALTHQNIGPSQNVAETQGGLEGLSSNINYLASGMQNQITAGAKTGQQAREEALVEMNKYGLNEADILRATGKTLKELFPDTKVVTPITKVTGTGTGINTSVIPGGYYGNDTGNPLTRTPGDITTNRDGTVTIQPNIPGRPTGGFPGMASVRDAYTAGGGSLGYIPYAPKTIEEFESKYNKLTGGSKQAYDYLTGKTPYSPTPYTPTGEVMKPYAESVLGMPVNKSKRMYIFDPATKTYKINPDYAIPTYDKDGNKTYNLTNKDVITYMATKPAPADFYNWAKTNNLTVEQIAAATGMPITEVQKMLTGGTPKDTATSTDNMDTTQGGGGGDGLAAGGLSAINMARGGQYDLGDYSDGGRLLRGPGDGVSDSIPASIGNKRPARLADGEFVVPARIVSELGNGSTEAGARKLYAMMDRIQAARRGTVGKGRVAKNSRADKHLPA